MFINSAQFALKLLLEAETIRQWEIFVLNHELSGELIKFTAKGISIIKLQLSSLLMQEINSEHLLIAGTWQYSHVFISTLSWKLFWIYVALWVGNRQSVKQLVTFGVSREMIGHAWLTICLSDVNRVITIRNRLLWWSTSKTDQIKNVIFVWNIKLMYFKESLERNTYK